MSNRPYPFPDASPSSPTARNNNRPVPTTTNTSLPRKSSQSHASPTTASSTTATTTSTLHRRSSQTKLSPTTAPSPSQSKHLTSTTTSSIPRRSSHVSPTTAPSPSHSKHSTLTTTLPQSTRLYSTSVSSSSPSSSSSVAQTSTQQPQPRTVRRSSQSQSPSQPQHLSQTALLSTSQVPHASSQTQKMPKLQTLPSPSRRTQNPTQSSSSEKKQPEKTRVTGDNKTGGTAVPVTGSSGSSSGSSSSRARERKPKPAMTPGEVMKKYASKLTPFEQSEILEYHQIYFVGNNATKIKGIPHTANNNGYDDERGDYRVMMNDHLEYRYEVLSVLGRGSFGQVLKVHDHKKDIPLALKIIRNKKRFHHQALVEVKILEHLMSGDKEHKSNIVRVYGYFYFRNHLCITFEALSINLYEFIKNNNFKGVSLSLIRRFAIQLLQALKFLRKERIIHCDLKPENILLKSPNKPTVKLIDFGSSCFINEKIYTYIQSRFYRSPEVILGLSYDYEIDMWSFGCILSELYTGYPLFPGENEMEQMQCIMEVLGAPPKKMIQASQRKKHFFGPEGTPLLVPNSRGKVRQPGSKDLATATRCNDPYFLSFLRRCLKWDPKSRMQPDKALEHHFITEGRYTPTSSGSKPSSSSSSSSHRSSRRRAPSGGGGTTLPPSALTTGTSKSSHHTSSNTLGAVGSQPLPQSSSFTSSQQNRRTPNKNIIQPLPLPDHAITVISPSHSSQIAQIPPFTGGSSGGHTKPKKEKIPPIPPFPVTQQIPQTQMQQPLQPLQQQPLQQQPLQQPKTQPMAIQQPPQGQMEEMYDYDTSFDNNLLPTLGMLNSSTQTSSKQRADRSARIPINPTTGTIDRTQKQKSLSMNLGSSLPSSYHHLLPTQHSQHSQYHHHPPHTQDDYLNSNIDLEVDMQSLGLRETKGTDGGLGREQQQQQKILLSEQPQQPQQPQQQQQQLSSIDHNDDNNINNNHHHNLTDLQYEDDTIVDEQNLDDGIV